MKVFPLLAVLVFSGLLVTSSCVSNKKYNESQAKLSNLRRMNRDLNEDLSDMKSRLELMEDANAAAANRLNLQDSTLSEKEQALLAQQEEMLRQKQQMEALQRLIDRQKEQTKGLREKMEKALGSFNSEELSVFQKDGKVYVRMSENLLFPSGSAEVNSKGKQALAKLAEALNQNPDIQINVEGHTDTVPIRIKFPDNWALSVARATSIVRVLVNDYKVDPKRLIASGRSQFYPVEDNASESGRAKNRRTEIILAPRLDRLMKLLDETD